MSVVVRFAPSPTGFLHIGGARTALFNWLYARHHQRYGEGGTFRLRIEDTDRVRSSPEAMAAIIDGLSWLGLEWDGDIVHQFAGAARHAEVAREMLAKGRAYHCYCTPEELETMRARARAEKRSVHIESPWRDRDPAEAPAGIAPVIRLKAPQEGATTIHDLVQGEVTVQNSELDDLIILRADGTPTYNLSVVVDDHDMGITHVIHGDDEIISTEDAIRWFDIKDVGRAAARFDPAKLDNVNAHYIREADDARLLALVAERLEAQLGRTLSEVERERLFKAMPGLKPRAKTIVELADKAWFYVAPRPIQPTPDAAKLLKPEAQHLLGELAAYLNEAEWQAGALEQRLRDFADSKNAKFGAVAQPLRAALTGSTASPGIFEVMEALGQDESLGRITDAAGGAG